MPAPRDIGGVGPDGQLGARDEAAEAAHAAETVEAESSALAQEAAALLALGDSAALARVLAEAAPQVRTSALERRVAQRGPCQRPKPGSGGDASSGDGGGSRSLLSWAAEFDVDRCREDGLDANADGDVGDGHEGEGSCRHSGSASLALVRALLSADADPGALDDSGETPLFGAVRAAGATASSAGGAASASVSAGAGKGRSEAAFGEDSDRAARLAVVDALLAARADANATRRRRRRPTGSEVGSGEPEADGGGDGEGETSLMEAACASDLEVCRMLLKARAEPALETDSGIAAVDFIGDNDFDENGHGVAAALRTLLSLSAPSTLQMGSDRAEEKDNLDALATAAAAASGGVSSSLDTGNDIYFDEARGIGDVGADSCVSNADGGAADLATESEPSLVLDEALADAARHRRLDEVRAAFLDVATATPPGAGAGACGSSDSGGGGGIRRLLRATTAGGDGYTLLHLAVGGPPNGEAAELAAWLVLEGADANARDVLGETPLIHAVRAALDECCGESSVRLEVVRALLESAADPNAADALSGETPLIEAACRGSAACCRLLLDCSADPSQASFAGAMPLSFAQGSGHEEVVELLRRTVDGEEEEPLDSEVDEADAGTATSAAEHEAGEEQEGNAEGDGAEAAAEDGDEDSQAAASDDDDDDADEASAPDGEGSKRRAKPTGAGSFRFMPMPSVIRGAGQDYSPFFARGSRLEGGGKSGGKFGKSMPIGGKASFGKGDVSFAAAAFAATSTFSAAERGAAAGGKGRGILGGKAKGFAPPTRVPPATSTTSSAPSASTEASDDSKPSAGAPGRTKIPFKFVATSVGGNSFGGGLSGTSSALPKSGLLFSRPPPPMPNFAAAAAAAAGARTAPSATTGRTFARATAMPTGAAPAGKGPTSFGPGASAFGGVGSGGGGPFSAGSRSMPGAYRSASNVFGKGGGFGAGIGGSRSSAGSGASRAPAPGGAGMDKHYNALGIRPGAGAEEVRRAYHRMALQFHPDKNGAPSAAERFRAAQGAYEVLSRRLP